MKEKKCFYIQDTHDAASNMHTHDAASNMHSHDAASNMHSVLHILIEIDPESKGCNVYFDKNNYLNKNYICTFSMSSSDQPA